MVFFDLVLWICVVLFLIGVVFILEEVLSSLFGYALIFSPCVYFAVYFWTHNMAVFSVLFAILVLLAIRFAIGQAMQNRRNRW